MADEIDNTQQLLDMEPPQSQLRIEGSKFEALKKNIGDSSHLLNELPFHRVELIAHADDDLIGRKTIAPWKIRVGTTKLFGEPIYAYLMNQTHGSLAVSFFSISADEQDVTIHDISTLVNEDLREEYAGAPTQESLKALVKLYFIQSGVCDDIPMLFSKSFLNEIDRVCKSHAKPKPVSRGNRRSSVFANSVQAQDSSPMFYSFQMPSRPATPLVPATPMMHASQPVTEADLSSHGQIARLAASQPQSRLSLQAAQNHYNGILELSSRNSSDSTISGSEIVNFPRGFPSTQPPMQSENQRQAKLPFQRQSQPQLQPALRVPAELQAPQETGPEIITFANYSTLFKIPYTALRTTLSKANTALKASQTALRNQDTRISQAKAQMNKAQAELTAAKREKDATCAKIKELECTKEFAQKEQKNLVDKLDDELKTVWHFAKEECEEASSDEEPLAKRLRME